MNIQDKIYNEAERLSADDMDFAAILTAGSVLVLSMLLIVIMTNL